MNEYQSEFIRLLEIVAKLRDPQKGCPWDVKQTHTSLIPYLIEESYEVIDAINTGDDALLIEELGDVLLQIFLHSQIASEAARFSMLEVLKVACEKLIRRHPHVFGELKLDSIDAVLENWEKIKKSEGKSKVKQGLFSGIPASLPALLKADRMGAKSARIGLDWDHATDVVSKVQEEIAEYLEVAQAASADKTTESLEFGDILFTLVQYGRKRGLDAEECLQQSCKKFANRVGYIESQLSEGATVAPDKLEMLWTEAKKQVG